MRDCWGKDAARFGSTFLNRGHLFIRHRSFDNHVSTTPEASTRAVEDGNAPFKCVCLCRNDTVLVRQAGGSSRLPTGEHV